MRTKHGKNACTAIQVLRKKVYSITQSNLRRNTPKNKNQMVEGKNQGTTALNRQKGYKDFFTQSWETSMAQNQED